MGGVTRSQFALSSAVTPFETFGWSTGYSVGVPLSTRLRRRSEKWRLHTELSGLAQRIEASRGRGVVEMQWLQTAVLARYYATTGSWSPYAEAGLTGRYLVGFEAQSAFGLDGYVQDKGRFKCGLRVETDHPPQSRKIPIEGMSF